MGLLRLVMLKGEAKRAMISFSLGRIFLSHLANSLTRNPYTNGFAARLVC